MIEIATLSEGFPPFSPVYTIESIFASLSPIHGQKIHDRIPSIQTFLLTYLSRQDHLLKQAGEQGLVSSLYLLPMDITCEQSIRSAVKAAIDKFGRMDVVVNNAGIAVGGYVEDVTMEQSRDRWR